MLTVDYERLGVGPGERLLDLGAGGGRHAFEALRRGARVSALDYSWSELISVRNTFGAMVEGGEVPPDAEAHTLGGDALALPFPDESFDRIIVSEVLEHIDDDRRALDELVRVLRPGGTLAATVPAWFPEWVCWRLSSEYHAPAAVGGHVRIFSRPELNMKLGRAGLEVLGHERVHALHSPYWWLRCLVGPHDDDHRLVRPYRRLLEWDIVHQPRLTRWTEWAFDPVLGKSLVVYALKPVHSDPAGGRLDPHPAEAEVSGADHASA